MRNVFIADDGTEFDTPEEAAKYEAVAGKKETIKAWVEKHYDNKRLTKKHLNVIMTWEANREEALEAFE